MSRNPGPTIFDRIVSLRLDAATEDALKRLAADTGLSQSELHRRSLHAMLSGVAGFGQPEPKTDDTEVTQ